MESCHEWVCVSSDTKQSRTLSSHNWQRIMSNDDGSGQPWRATTNGFVWWVPMDLNERWRIWMSGIEQAAWVRGCSWTFFDGSEGCTATYDVCAEGWDLAGLGDRIETAKVMNVWVEKGGGWHQRLAAWLQKTDEKWDRGERDLGLIPSSNCPWRRRFSASGGEASVDEWWMSGIAMERRYSGGRKENYASQGDLRLPPSWRRREKEWGKEMNSRVFPISSLSLSLSQLHKIFSLCYDLNFTFLD